MWQSATSERSPWTTYGAGEGLADGIHARCESAAERRLRAVIVSASAMRPDDHFCAPPLMSAAGLQAAPNECGGSLREQAATRVALRDQSHVSLVDWQGYAALE